MVNKKLKKNISSYCFFAEKYKSPINQREKIYSFAKDEISISYAKLRS